MREILFRGKIKDEFYIQLNSTYKPQYKMMYGDLLDMGNGNLAIKYKGDNYDLGTYVIPETVGQYTGLRDKNGVKIFEGDILKHISITPQFETELWHQVIGKVLIDKGMTYLLGECTNGYIGGDITLTNYKAILLSPDIFEVIGNIHDNPELLEVE